MENPSAESIIKRVEDLTGIVDWVAEIWHGKNWVRRLLLLDVLLFVAFDQYFPTVLKLIPDSFNPSGYDRYFWAAVGRFFVVALIIRTFKQNGGVGKDKRLAKISPAAVDWINGNCRKHRGPRSLYKAFFHIFR